MKFTKVITVLLTSSVLFCTVDLSIGQVTRKPAPVVKLTKDQASEVKKEAADLFKRSNYMAAIGPYTQLVNYDPENVDFNYFLGMSYLNSNSDKSEAIQYFVKAADKKEAPNDVYFQMGKALLSAGLFDEAIDAFEKYKEVNKGQVNPKFNFEQHQEYCYNAREYVKNPLSVKFVNPGKVVNSPNADYACVSMALDTVVYFTSNRKGNMGGIVDGFGEIIPDIYFSSRMDTVWTKAKNPGININSEFYDISTGMNSNGDKLMIYKESGFDAGDIYFSQMKGKTWQKAEILHESLATKTFETGAVISNDGKQVYFSANMKGTLGGKDIFMIEKEESGKWSAPVNLGPTVNTKYDEDNPVLWHDGKTLFFASQGHNSMGGYDIFMTSRPDRSADWTKPVNVGYPLNNFDDNLYFTLSANARTGYVSAVRKEGLGDLDIYYFELEEPLIGNAGVLFRASILNAQGLPAKDVMCSVVKESTGEILGIMEASGVNSEVFILLQPGTYKLKARSPKMGRLEEEIIVKGDEEKGIIHKSLKLQPNPSSKL